jgi:hypothetical protein
MSYIQENFMVDRGAFNGSLTPVCFGIHRYNSAFDSLAIIESFDYFPPYFGYDSDSIKNNDYLLVQDNQRNFKQYLVSLDEFGDITLTSSFTDLVIPSIVLGLDPVLTPATSLTFYVRQGSVYLNLADFAFTTTSVVSIASISPAIPTNLLPPLDIGEFYNYIFLEDNSVLEYGLIGINSSTGVIQIGLSGVDSGLPITQFDNGPMGWPTSLYSWPLQTIIT